MDTPQVGSALFALSPAEAALRLPGVAWADWLPARAAFVALPIAYPTKPRRRFPLVVALTPDLEPGGAIEIARLMAETGEIEDCVLVLLPVTEAERLNPASVSAFLRKTLLPGCVRRYRVANDKNPVVIENATLPELTQRLRDTLSTGRAYGQQIGPLRHPLVVRVLEALRPLIAGRRIPMPTSPPGAQRLHADGLGRDFEIFVSLPPSYEASGSRRYPLLLALDANIEFSIVADTAARLARGGATQEMIVVGVGIPRNEGMVTAGYRRLEELSPPTTGYAFDDSLGRIFRSMFALRGQKAAERLGQAPAFLDFLIGELLPLLRTQYPVDDSALGLLGHSAAGTFTGYALAQAESPFRRYAAISPGIAISGDWLTRQDWHAPTIARQGAHLFTCLGDEERDNAFNKDAGIHQTEAWSKQVARNPRITITSLTFMGETHSSVFPIAVETALRALYPHLTA